jgi:predicted transglutaminase-like cysteine proteinase
MFLSQVPGRSIIKKTLPPGAEGVRATLNEMRKMVRDHKYNDQVRSTAAEIVSPLNQKNFMGEIKRLHAYVRDNIRYLRDIHGVEVLQSPPETLRRGYGDCDDKAILLATMLEVIGHPARFVAVGKAPGKFTHVYVETRVGPKWIGLETTEPVEAGWQPPNVLARMVAHI